MFGKGITLFRIFGFKVRVDASWIIIAVLVTWSLAEGFLPQRFPGMSASTYWILGAVCALGLFASIVFHELSHSLVARQFGLEMKGITLFIFGGVSEMPNEPPSAGAEFWTGVVGPLSSVFLSAVFFGLYVLARFEAWPEVLAVALFYLCWINGLLAVFNMLPAFPLDGGRVLRSALWGLKGDVRWATSVASTIGSGFGILLIVLGVLAFVRGEYIGGVWSFLIGMFLRSSAKGSYQQLLIRQALQGEKVSRFMNPSPVTAPASATVQSLVDDYIYRYHFKMFPVIENGQLAGCVSTREVSATPRDRWATTHVGELVRQCDADTAVPPDMDAAEALGRMARTRTSRLLVVEGRQLVGILTLKDLMDFLSLRMELHDTDR